MFLSDTRQVEHVGHLEQILRESLDAEELGFLCRNLLKSVLFFKCAVHF